jgi:hypothetical protein
MLRPRNTHVVLVDAMEARLTMNAGMATLYSRFAARVMDVRWAIERVRAEGSRRINRVFCDVLRQFECAGVVKRRQWSAGSAVMVAVLLGGCAAGSSFGGLTADAPADVKRDVVAARAKARWDALIKLDVAGAYSFLSPASRATMSLDQYKAKHKVGMYRAVNVDDVNCDRDACTVRVTLTYDYRRFKGITTPLVEKWIIAEGQAWFVEQG